MNDFPEELGSLQRWMQTVITHPGGIVAGLLSDDARRERDVDGASLDASLDTVVRPSRLRTSVERLSVYGNAYFARLLECLRTEFPVVCRTIGESTFDIFAVSYLQDLPSTSYTLGALGEQFPRYLNDHRPAKNPAAPPDWADWIVDLATLERIRTEAFDGPGDERESSHSPLPLQAVPEVDRPAARLRLSRSLRLASFRFDLLPCFAIPGEDTSEFIAQPPPPPCVSYVAIHRWNWRVRLTPLTDMQHRLLMQLHTGTPLQIAIENAFDDDSQPIPAGQELAEWFHDWTAAGLIRGPA